MNDTEDEDHDFELFETYTFDPAKSIREVNVLSSNEFDHYWVSGI